MQLALLEIHFMILLEKPTHLKSLEIQRNLWGSLKTFVNAGSVILILRVVPRPKTLLLLLLLVTYARKCDNIATQFKLHMCDSPFR